MSDRAVVIVGNGQAGVQVAASLREAGFDGRIQLLGNEDTMPYQRPPLSKAYLAHDADARDLLLRSVGFFAENSIEVSVGDAVTGIDRSSKRVMLASGRTICYAHLVLATGATPRSFVVEGAHVEGVRRLHSMADADRLRADLGKARRIVVAGGGFIGMEFAAHAAKHGHHVTVVDRNNRALARAVSPEVSEFLTRAHMGHGVEFHFGAAIERFRGRNGHVSCVELTSGAGAEGTVLAADLVLVGIGVEPNTALATQAGLAVSNGISVDEDLVTSDPCISAIGDCASFPAVDGRGRVRLESVQNAVDQARHIAARIASGTTAGRYSKSPWFWTRQYGLNVQIAGIGYPDDERVVRPGPEPSRFSVFRYQGAQLVGIESVNSPADHMAARKLLDLGISPAKADAADSSTQLKELLLSAVPA